MTRRIPPDAIGSALVAFGKTDDESARLMRQALKASGAVFPGTEFMGAAEAAEELGVKSPNLRRVRGLPPPFGQVRSGPFWIADDIRALAERREPVRCGGVLPPALGDRPPRGREVVERDDRDQVEVAAGRDHPLVVVEVGGRELAVLGLDA